jgi:nucleotide-binding universal stress UspA family protein
VLRGAKNDVLLIRAGEQIHETKGIAQLKRIIVPLDGSELAENALACASELAKKMNLEILLVRAYLMPGVAYPTGAYAPDWKLLDEEKKEIAREYLERKVNELRSEGLDSVSFTAVEGGPAEKILDIAKEKPQSLIAMSTHGAGGAGRWVFGSVTERVIRHSETPVLVVRDERTDITI